jgi:hypothetical protein
MRQSKRVHGPVVRSEYQFGSHVQRGLESGIHHFFDQDRQDYLVSSKNCRWGSAVFRFVGFQFRDAQRHAVKPRILCTAIDIEDTSASLDLALSVADYFDLKPDQAKSIAAEVGTAVSGWRREAKKAGIADSEIDRMASAFDHEDLRKATELTNKKAVR